LRSVRSSPAAAGHGSSSLEGGGGWWARTTPSFTPGTGFQPAAAQTGRLHPPKSDRRCAGLTAATVKQSVRQAWSALSRDLPKKNP
jgi:hypothetical protein